MKLLISISLIFLVSSCSVLFSDFESKKKRGSLSDAIDKASDENKGSRVVDSKPSNRDEENEEEEKEDNEKENLKHPKHQNENTRSKQEDDEVESNKPIETKIGLSLQISKIYSDNFQQLNEISFNYYLMNENDNNKMSFSLSGQIGKFAIQDGAQLKKSINNDVVHAVFGLGLYYNLSKRTYIETHLGFGNLNWTYKNAIISGDDRIYSDNLSTYQFGNDISIYLILSESIVVKPSIGYRFLIFGCETLEGFENDYFTNFSQIHFKVSFLF